MNDNSGLIGRRNFLAAAAGSLAAQISLAQPANAYQIGAYYFPGWHSDPNMEALHGRGWTEWELLRRGEPKFPGHQQPKRPAWGHENESDPTVFERKIDAAANHCLTHFIFDWYWYDGAPFLQRALENGYLGAHNNNRLKFCLMWANHDWIDLFPAKASAFRPTMFAGATGRASFEKMTDYVVSKYFNHPSYWTIDGCPYFSVYELYRLVLGLGGVRETAAALQSFRSKTRAAGFPDVHLNAVTWGIQLLPGEKSVKNTRELLAAVNFDSSTSYVWIHHVPMPDFPITSYRSVAERSAEQWPVTALENGLPYFPNVTMGWDPSPRTCQSDVYANNGYPFTPILTGNTPSEFQRALSSAKKFLDSRPKQRPILTLNAWNEWTEGSYLEPDILTGTKYLEAIRNVFGGGEAIKG